MRAPALWAAALGLVRDELESVHYAIRSLAGRVRVAPYATFGSRELAANVRRAIEGRRAALMRNHGAVAKGASLSEAACTVETLEGLCRLDIGGSHVGEPAV